MPTREEMIQELLNFHVWRLFHESMDDLIDEYNELTEDQEDDLCDDCREKRENNPQEPA
jgi:hypothetical protein